MAASNDFKSLHQRQACLHHRCQLARKNCDVFLGNTAFACGFDFADAQRTNASALEFFARLFFIFGNYFAADKTFGLDVFSFKRKTLTFAS